MSNPIPHISQPAWMRHALCRGHDNPDLWHATQHDEQREAMRICRMCPVRAECAAFGADDPWGIWGGQTAGIRANRRKEPA